MKQDKIPNFLQKKTKSDSIIKMEEKLFGSKFRILNEKLYTISSEDAYQYFQDNPEDFEIVKNIFLIQSIIKDLKYKQRNGRLIRI